MRTESTTKRIRELIDKIEDKEVREVVREAMNVEIQNQSWERERFPYSKLRQIIQNTVNRKNLNTDQ